MQTKLPPSVIQEEDMLYIHQAPYPYCFNGSSIEIHQPIMNVSQEHPLLGIQAVSAGEQLLRQRRLGSQCHEGRTAAATRGGYLPLPQLDSKKQFPDKLYDMLEMADQQNFGCSSNAVSWMPHGRAFKVFDEDVFMTCLVPMFFRQTKLRSFNRQLNLWGFKRLTKGHDEGGWYHESFVRGSPNKLKDMIRTKIKGTTMKSASTMISDLTEPNFYNLPSSMPSTTQADELPEPSFERNNSCSGVSVGSNESVYGSKKDVAVGTHCAVLSKSRRVSVEQAVECMVPSSINHRRVHDSWSFHKQFVANEQYFHETVTSSSVPLLGLSLANECKNDHRHESIEPLPFKNDIGFGDLVHCIDNVMEAL